MDMSEEIRRRELQKSRQMVSDKWNETQQDFAVRAIESRLNNPEKKHHLTDIEKEMIVATYLRTRSMDRVAALYGVTRQTVSKIVNQDRLKLQLFKSELDEKEAAILNLSETNVEKMQNIFDKCLDFIEDHMNNKIQNIQEATSIWEAMSKKMIEIEKLRSDRKRYELERIRIQFEAEKLQLKKDQMALIRLEKQPNDLFTRLKEDLLILDSDFEEVE